jgi:hypothetical protein
VNAGRIMQILLPRRDEAAILIFGGDSAAEKNVC